MSNKDFDAFVERQLAATPETSGINWDDVRGEWLGYLASLYTKIESFLTDYVSSNKIQFEYHELELNEINIGAYKARQMVMKVGRQEITISPIGTLLIGCKGRVDVLGPVGSAQILLVDRKATSSRSLFHVSTSEHGTLPAAPKESLDQVEWEWKIATPPPAVRFTELKKATFLDLIVEVANG